MIVLDDNVRGRWMEDIHEFFVLSLCFSLNWKLFQIFKNWNQAGAGDSAILNSPFSITMIYKPPGLEEITFFFCCCFLRDYYWILSKRSCLVGFIKSGLSSSVSSSNRLGCFGAILPRRAIDILDKYLNVFFKSLESYKWSGMTSPRVKREEKFMRNELGVWILFLFGPVLHSTSNSWKAVKPSRYFWKHPTKIGAQGLPKNGRF